MGSLTVPRRQLLRGFASLAVCAPAVVCASKLMQVSARFCGSSHVIPACAATQEALSLLQHEMERRLAETLFGAERLSAESENAVLTRLPLVGEAKLTALWELRMLFGPRGSPLKPLEELPAEARARLFSLLEPSADLASAPWAAQSSGLAGRERALRAPFDNPCRSWNMSRARSLDYARG
jgi:hypothetical protein